MNELLNRYRVPELTSGLLIAAWAFALMIERAQPSAMLLACGQAFVWIYLVTIPHELGHAVAAKLAGSRVRLVRIGTGPSLLGIDAGNTRLEINLWLGGHCMVDDALTVRSHYRARSFLITLAGPMTNLALASIAWFLGGQTLFPEHGLAAWQAFLAANLGVALSSLWPWTLYEGEDRYPSDGLQLLMIPRMTDEEVDEEISEAERVTST